MEELTFLRLSVIGGQRAPCFDFKAIIYWDEPHSHLNQALSALPRCAFTHMSFY